MTEPHEITTRNGITQDGNPCLIRKYARFGKVISWTLIHERAELADWVDGQFVGRDSGVVVRLLPDSEAPHPPNVTGDVDPMGDG